MKWHQTELERLNEDQKTVKIENLEKLCAAQKEQMNEQFKDTLKVQVKDAWLRGRNEELQKRQNQRHSLEQDKIKYRERLDEMDMR